MMINSNNFNNNIQNNMFNNNIINNNFQNNMVNNNDFSKTFQKNNYINDYNNYNNIIPNNEIMSKSQGNNKMKTILLKFEDGKKYSVITFDRCLLRDDVFSAALAQMDPNNQPDIFKFSFHLNGQDITKYFYNNDSVSCLKLSDFSTIEVCKIKNIFA